MSELTDLQNAFYAYVTSGEPLGDMIASGDPAIYARMYASRLHDALADDFPKLRAAIGQDEFAAMAWRYVQARPPHAFSLRDAGLLLSDYLRATPSEAAIGLWATEMAVLERARVEVFDGRDAVALEQEDVAALGDALPHLMLRWVPASRLVMVTWNVDDMWSAIEDDSAAVVPCDASRAILVWRRGNVVVHRTLDHDEAALAPQLGDGASFADVCEVLAAFHGDQAAPRAVELLLRWLQAQVIAAV
jgi:hypothetical protein